MELKDIRRQQDLLFRFINFLKQEGAVHVLQFCLAVGKFCSASPPVLSEPGLTCVLPEEFNDKILSPELSDAELQRLHGEVLHMYQTYCLDESVDKISFDASIVEEIRNSKEPPWSGSIRGQL